MAKINGETLTLDGHQVNVSVEERITEVRVVKGGDKVKSLKVGNGIHQIDWVKDLPNLEVLNIKGTQVDCLEPLTDHPSLKVLILNHLRPVSFKPLKTIKGLEVLQCPNSAEAVDLGEEMPRLTIYSN